MSNTPIYLQLATPTAPKMSLNAQGGIVYPQYAEDYYAIFLNDPDGIRLELSNFRKDRRERFEGWEQPGRRASASG